MSIVGPRPIIYNPYSEGIGEKIYKNKPGLTGIGSIIFGDEEALISNTKLNKKIFTIIIYVHIMVNLNYVQRK